MIFDILFRTINAGKTPKKNEDQSVAGMFCLNVSKSASEADDEGSPTHVSQVQLRQELKYYRASDILCGHRLELQNSAIP